MSLGYALLGLGLVLPPDQTERTFTSLDEAVALMTDLDDPGGVGSALGTKGGRAGVAGDRRTMLRASIDAIHLEQRVGALEVARVSSMIDANEAQLRAALGAVRVTELNAHGATLGLADALALARAAERELEE